MANMFIGNKTTLETRPRELGIDVQKALLEFHEKYYSANIMSLTVIGKGKVKIHQHWLGKCVVTFAP